MLASLQRRQRDVLVVAGGGGDDHGFDLLVIQDGLVILGQRRGRGNAGDALQSGRVGVADCRNIGFRDSRQRVDDFASPGAQSDHCHLQFDHVDLGGAGGGLVRLGEHLHAAQHGHHRRDGATS